VTSHGRRPLLEHRGDKQTGAYEEWFIDISIFRTAKLEEERSHGSAGRLAIGLAKS
jgi:hypothetical protein